MESAKIIKQFTKFILPFRYVRPETAPEHVLIENGKGKPVNVFIRTSQEGYRLRGGLEMLLDADGGKTKIADVYELNNACRQAFGLPKRPKDFASFYSRGENGHSCRRLTINSVRVFLFESGVGFFETEIIYESDDTEDFIDCNYYISETKSDKNYFETAIEKYDTEKKQKTYDTFQFTLTQLADKALSFFKTKDGKSAVKKEAFYGSKALFYSYVYFDRKPDDLDTLLFNMRKNYKGSYKFPNNAKQGADPYLKQQFENSFWGASLNGAVNVSFAVGDEMTDAFFENNFFALAHQTYYTLFLHTLHQRYALLLFIERMGELDKLSTNYEVMEEQLKDARACKAAAANLNFRAFFKQPSNIDHINDYYSLLLRSFRISELHKGFTEDLANLENICNVYVTRIKERDAKIEKRRRTKIEIFVAVFATLVGVVSLFNDYWGLVEKVLGTQVNLFSIQMLVFGGLLLLPLVTSLVDVFYRIKDVRKITDDLNKEMEDGLVEDDKKRKKKERFKKRFKNFKK